MKRVLGCWYMISSEQIAALAAALGMGVWGINLLKGILEND